MQIKRIVALLAALWAVATGTAQAGAALCPAAALPAQGAPVRGAAPLGPADHWWNLDVRGAPVDSNSAAYIAYINNGGTRRLHPDFGGEESPGSVAIYGIPYAVVGAGQQKLPVTFEYWDESDGVDLATGQGRPFYPIPTQSVTQPHWVEGGAPANVDQRSSNDRHLLMVDCANNHLYELYNVWYDAASNRWHAGSGAFFDMNTNARRPNGWTSADAAGLAIFPGLVRYDEVYDAAVTEIGHALRVTVRRTNGYVWPASHRAGSTAGALPMGARLRLKPLVNGVDPVTRTTNPQMQKIFRAMQKHGLIVADNGSDMYVTGTFDRRWNNGILNPAFALLSASDFEVVQLGWNPVGATAVLNAVAASPASVTGGAGATGSVTLSAPAPAGGALVALSSNASAARVPSSVTVAQGASSATFAITTVTVTANVDATLSASYAGVTRTASFAVKAAAAGPVQLSSVGVSPSRAVGGAAVTGTVALTAPAPAGGSVVALSSSNTYLAKVPASVTVPAGATSATFTATTFRVQREYGVKLTAAYGGRSRQATLTLTPQ